MSGYTFPDVPAALLEVVPRSTLWLEDVNQTINHLYSAGGTESGPLRFDRIVINTYAEGRTASRDEAEQVRELLVSGPHETSEGLIDFVEVEVPPHDILFQSSTVTQHQAIYRVHTRTI